MLELDTVYNIDCLTGMREIESSSIDMIFCDLPYGTTQNKWDSVIPLEKLWEQYNRIIKTNGVILLFGQNMFTAKMILSNYRYYRYNIVWEKTTPTGFLNANKIPLRIHEDIMVFYKSLPTYNPQKTKGNKRKTSTLHHKRNSLMTSNYGKYEPQTYDSTERFPTDVWKFPTDKQKLSIHPTQKPVDLCRYAIRTYTNSNDIILDNCCGSGSILVAAKLENRHYIGMDNGICENEKSQYFQVPWADISKRRLLQSEREMREVD